ncbi:MAG: hypothetical protein HOI66_07775, partial [Verrucomicrobia bacterium]|nr:hypothetical protein [Verrucomicrobiota bacterium]
MGMLLRKTLLVHSLACVLIAACCVLVIEAAEDGEDSVSLVRQLNESFVRVADTVSASVVVIEVAHRRGGGVAPKQQLRGEWFELLH